MGCSYCYGLKVSLSNCLATVNPELAKEWHPTLNDDLTPCNIYYGSNKKVWWQCSKNPKHEWKTSISNRNNRKDGCPYCYGRYATDENNLLLNNPELCKEWNYKKNNKKPENYTPQSHKHVWWICKECRYEWTARIGDRNKNGNGCPQCNESKGEKQINNFFTQNNIYFQSQKEFDKLIGLGGRNLSYDFYLPQYNLLIEYQGEQHEKYIPGFHKSKKDFEKQLEHDKRKRKFTKNNNINLLEIWYYDFDNIEQILNNILFK